MSALAYTAIVAAPFGPLGLVTEAERLCRIDFLPSATACLAPPSGSYAVEVAAQLAAYFADPRHAFSLDCALVGSDFQQQVWRAIAAIPCGAMISYQTLAERVGSVARAVGSACGRNPLPIVIPCHRVVARAGLGGFNRQTAGAMTDIKRYLLAHEAR